MLKMPPKPTHRLPVEAQITLRRAFDPSAAPVEREAGENLLRQALDLLLMAACENAGWLTDQVKKLGVGSFVARLLVRALRLICRKL